jgi:hypothetical protein
MTEVRRGLERQVQRDDEVSEPLNFAVIQKEGFRRL